MNRYTEDEAKQKWCPFARVKASGTDRNSFNRLFSGIGKERRSDESPESSRCIGSRCMAWLVDDKAYVERLDAWAEGDEPVEDAPQRADYRPVEMGYCGLVRS